MPYKYEWKETRGGRRYVRTEVREAPKSAPVEPASEAVAEAEYVPEVKIEDPQQKRGPGRPKKVAPVEVDDDE